MDYSKIGNFIAAERKAKNLTQAKLAQELFVSEKTVSKWENGKGIPETTLLPKLCKILDLSLNELLNGQRIEKENKEQNEKLLIDITQEIQQKNKIIWTSMWMIMGISIIAMLTGLAVAAFLLPKGIWQLVCIIAICIVFLIPCFYALKLEISIGTYNCKHCGYKIKPTYKQALKAMHIGTTRFLKCPNCHKRSWCKKVVKSSNTEKATQNKNLKA